MAAPSAAMSPETLITIKVSVNDSLKKLKLPLKDLGANVLLVKLRQLLAIKPEQTVVFERFSDSAGGYITLDPNNAQVFKTLIRAAKAKSKLRLKATVSPLPEPAVTEAVELPEEKSMHKPTGPAAAARPLPSIPSLRESTAMDRRSVGSGIFQFREALATQAPLVDVSEAPVPLPFNHSIARNSNATLEDVLKASSIQQNNTLQRGLPIRSRQPVVATPTADAPKSRRQFNIHCNVCDVAMDDAHFHCNICERGDYDLCEDCVASGKLCQGEGHWLIKRSIQDGVIISSTTERISPRKSAVQPEAEVLKDIPGAFTEETKTLAEPLSPTRTCNCCIIVLPEREFVTCQACDDFDLCVKCHSDNQHGHHPAHAFKAAMEDTFLPRAAEVLLAPGRNTRHNAICDGCDKKIMGVRHKCLNCPDWDYCSECFKSASQIHPHHRFAPLYESIPEARGFAVRHDGIFCDGPMCKGKVGRQNYIHGVRYKCAVCHDTDFCATCEALPNNQHNRTHPLIKFRTQVRNVSITTENEDLSGQMRLMGDRYTGHTKTASTETLPVPQANAATQVQTVAEIKPTEVKPVALPIPVVKPATAKPTPPVPSVHPSLLMAHFVQDSISDGTVLEPSARFTQMWTLRNPGPFAWPAGCSVRFVGGDNMLNLDNSHPAAVSDVNNASESNIIGRDVPMGEEVAFKITLKAPVREGKHISYWRMKTAEGFAFGHRLWCDIEVKQAQVVAPPAPAAMMGSRPIVAPPSGPPSPWVQALRRQQLQLQQQQHRRQTAGTHIQAGVPGLPPPYNDASAIANPTNRLFHEQQAKLQAKRRDHMLLMQQFNSQAEALKAASTNPKQATPEEQSQAEKARKDAARQRVEHIKAKILRAREEQAKAMEAEKKKVDEEKKKVDEEMEKVRKIVDAVLKVDSNKQEEKSEDLEGSQMVFPKLDKESPASSTYESAESSSNKGKAAYVENEEGEIEHSASPSVVSPAPAPAVLEIASPMMEEAFDLGDDIEVLSAHDGDESEDDGFLTDEEYDILNASDHETVKSM